MIQSADICVITMTSQHVAVNNSFTTENLFSQLLLKIYFHCCIALNTVLLIIDNFKQFFTHTLIQPCPM